jgi:hypothetical protein
MHCIFVSRMFEVKVNYLSQSPNSYTFEEPGIDSKESIPPSRESIPGLLTRFTNSGSVLQCDKGGLHHHRTHQPILPGRFAIIFLKVIQVTTNTKIYTVKTVLLYRRHCFLKFGMLCTFFRC